MRSRLLVVALGLFALTARAFGQGAAPTITSSPMGMVAFVNDTVTLTVTADGSTPINLQWRKAFPGTPATATTPAVPATPPANISGATGTSFTITGVTLADYGLYDVVATNSFGSTTSVPALLYVVKRPQTIAFSPPTAMAAGSGLVMNAAASSNLPVSYSVLSGAATLAGSVLTGYGGTVVVRASQAGNSTFAAADAVDRTINFVAGAISPLITSPPADQTVTAGTTVTFRAATIGTPTPAYQWFRDGAAIPGATDASLVLANTTLASSARYSVTASNFVGTASAGATLTVRQAPVFTVAPVSQAVPAGTTVTLAVEVGGFPIPTLQWRKNGVAIPGATNSAHRVLNPSANEAGRYDVVATNALGVVTSPAATLTVISRDFTGTYFGQMAGNATPTTPSGDFALIVQPNRSAVFLAYAADTRTGMFANVNVDVAGNVAQTIATTARPVSLQLTLDDATGQATGAIAELGVKLQGTRAERTGSSSAIAGLYPLVVIGTAATTGTLVVAPDGQAFLVTTSGTTIEAARGAVGSNGRLAMTSTGSNAIDLGFNAGAATGTARNGNNVATLAGALGTAVGAERMANLSVRSPTVNAAPLITGFVINGTVPKQVLIRAAGPALAQAPFNVAGALPDPTLQVFRGSTVVAQNDDWSTPPANGAAVAAAATRTGAFPFRNGSNDAALVTTLSPGPYTVLVGGGNGTALAEVYEVLETSEAPGTRRLVNISARGIVAPGSPLIAGFVISGTAPQRVLVRGIGPTLANPPFSVASALPNPQLTIFSGTTPVKTNDDWSRDPDANLIRDAAVKVGAFALGAQSPDAALLVYLQPGAYTAQVSGPANANAAQGTGIALVEIYEAAP